MNVGLTIEVLYFTTPERSIGFLSSTFRVKTDLRSLISTAKVLLNRKHLFASRQFQHSAVSYSHQPVYPFQMNTFSSSPSRILPENKNFACLLRRRLSSQAALPPGALLPGAIVIRCHPGRKCNQQRTQSTPPRQEWILRINKLFGLASPPFPQSWGVGGGWL